MTPRNNHPARLRLRVLLDNGRALGPGKADLLDGIRATGSIAGAARGLHMSYKRAWQLAEELNQCFRAPLIEASKGGSGGGGAQLSALGEKVLACFRELESRSALLLAAELRALQRYTRREED